MWQFKMMIAVLLVNSVQALRAGPPFLTDDPEPVEYQHWEFYLASMVNDDASGWLGTSPHIEINYGAIPDLQLHLITPVEFSAPPHQPAQVGYGDTELGIKYRFVHETDMLPQIGVFPLIEVPTGSENRGLGSGHTDAFLPVWMQKSFGKWTTYGGGGYWINPGADNRNWWFAGGMLQRQITCNLALGMEIFHETAQTRDGSSNTGIDVGCILDFSEQYHILFSIGRSVQGPTDYVGYLGFQLTFGPENPEKK
jgi:hypothetical protein